MLNRKISYLFISLIVIITLWPYLKDFGDYCATPEPNRIVKHVERQSKTYTKEKVKQPRKNHIIIAHGRSGSSITGDIFNRHDSVFYLFEPIQTIHRIYEHRTEKKLSYSRFFTSTLTDMLRCSFSQEIADDFHRYYHTVHYLDSTAMENPPFCPYKMGHPKWDPKDCNVTVETLTKTCNNFNMTVMKILIHRMDKANILSVINACQNDGIDCKILFLVRDPWSIIPSSRLTGFFEKGQTLESFSNQSCKQTEDNLSSILKRPPYWKNRITVERYEEFGLEPLKAMFKYLRFAGLPEQTNIGEWLERRTQESKNKGMRMDECFVKGKYHYICTVDDSTKAVHRWRWKVPFQEVVVIESFCLRTMSILGYIPINGSRKLMSNISIPLFHKANLKSKGDGSYI